MLTDLTGSGRIIVAGIATGKPGRIDCCYWDFVAGRIEQVHGLSEYEAKVQRFYPLEKFLKRGEMRDLTKLEYLLNLFHVPNILDDIPVMLVPVFLEKNEDEKLILRVDLFRIFAGIRSDMC